MAAAVAGQADGRVVVEGALPDEDVAEPLAGQRGLQHLLALLGGDVDAAYRAHRPLVAEAQVGRGDGGEAAEREAPEPRAAPLDPRGQGERRPRGADEEREHPGSPHGKHPQRQADTRRPRHITPDRHGARA